jgi:hypothetical protein
MGVLLLEEEEEEEEEDEEDDEEENENQLNWKRKKGISVIVHLKKCEMSYIALNLTDH